MYVFMMMMMMMIIIIIIIIKVEYYECNNITTDISRRNLKIKKRNARQNTGL